MVTLYLNTGKIEMEHNDITELLFDYKIGMKGINKFSYH